jgi:hypothetical protein
MRLQGAFLAVLAVAVQASPTHSNHFDIARNRHRRQPSMMPSSLPDFLKVESDAAAASHCFPSAGFQMPSSVPPDVDNWWCDSNTEYAFLGFSYEVTMCMPFQRLFVSAA